MLAQPIARALDLNHDGVVKQAIKQCGCDDGISKNISPFCKTAVGCQDHGAFLVAGIDQLEEQIAARWDDRQVADFIDDEQGEATEEADSLA